MVKCLALYLSNRTITVLSVNKLFLVGNMQQNCISYPLIRTRFLDFLLFRSVHLKVTIIYWLLLLRCVHGISSGNLLIWRNFEFWSTNICYCLLSAPQSQFKTKKKRACLIGQLFFCWTNERFIFSFKKKENKYSHFEIRNFIKLANH